ncbi:MAG: hypothetical protein JWM86_443 [Thermoleophilia bacterium]|nr:hypothetical protein [Thermoleophilia bacterium]
MSRATWATSVIDGSVTHARDGDVKHRFTYPYRAMLVDVDELARLDRAAPPLFGVDRARPVSLRTSDHLATEEGSTIRERAAACFARHEIDVTEGGRLLGFLTLRGFGSGFDPVTVWLWYAPNGGSELEAVIVDVHNTYGESHPYACSAECAGWVHARFDKQFHVSPFLAIDGTYDIAIWAPDADPEPEDIFQLRVRFDAAESRDRIVATIRGTRTAITSRSLRRMLLERSLQGLVSTVRIRVHAWRLWRLGARFRRKPAYVPLRGHATQPPGSTR